ncbi:unnamed protein product [Eretmochelys imbricata]
MKAYAQINWLVSKVLLVLLFFLRIQTNTAATLKPFPPLSPMIQAFLCLGKLLGTSISCQFSMRNSVQDQVRSVLTLHMKEQRCGGEETMQKTGQMETPERAGDAPNIPPSAMCPKRQDLHLQCKQHPSTDMQRA